MENTAYIPTKNELKEIVSREVRNTVMEVLPDAIREASRKEWLDTDDVMEILQCSRPHVQYLRDSKKLDFYQDGRTVRYKYEDVIAYINKGKVSRGEQ